MQNRMFWNGRQEKESKRNHWLSYNTGIRTVEQPPDWLKATTAACVVKEKGSLLFANREHSHAIKSAHCRFVSNLRASNIISTCYMQNRASSEFLWSWQRSTEDSDLHSESPRTKLPRLHRTKRTSQAFALLTNVSRNSTTSDMSSKKRGLFNFRVPRRGWLLLGVTHKTSHTCHL